MGAAADRALLSILQVRSRPALGLLRHGHRKNAGSITGHRCRAAKVLNISGPGSVYRILVDRVRRHVVTALRPRSYVHGPVRDVNPWWLARILSVLRRRRGRSSTVPAPV
jgi:hypothetical protein